MPKITVDHAFIQAWVQERGGMPASGRMISSNREPGPLAIDYSACGDGEDLQVISWNEFFKRFEDEHLAFLYPETAAAAEDGRGSRLISRMGKALPSEGRH